MIRLTALVLSLTIPAAAAAFAPDTAVPGGGAPPSAFSFSDEETARARERMIGTWYGEKEYPNGARQRWVVTRAEDGAYLVHFRYIGADGDVTESREIGMWGIRMPIYFTSVRYFVEDDRAVPANTVDPSLYDAYRVQELTDDVFRYRSYRSGMRFEMRKVGPDFELRPLPPDSGEPRP